MSHNFNSEMKLRHEYANHVMSRTYSSYQEFKSNQEEQRLLYLISTRYLKLLGKFIENMYEGLKFDIFIRHRDPKIKNPQWYGQTYMELRIFDVINVYEPHRFNPVFKTPHYEGYFYGEDIYNNIDSFIPEINKHLLISFSSIHLCHIPLSEMINNMNEIPDFECWGEYFSREYHRHASLSNFNPFERFGV